MATRAPISLELPSPGWRRYPVCGVAPPSHTGSVCSLVAPCIRAIGAQPGSVRQTDWRSRAPISSELPSPGWRRSRNKGFTLLEVMVSLAILSMSLVAILNLHSGTVRVHNYSKHLTVATLLARSKMIDLEEDLLHEGLPEFNESSEGSFEEEGYPGYWWRVEVIKPELGMDAATIQGLLGQAAGFLGGGDPDESSMLGGMEAMAGAGIEGMIQGQVQGLLDTLQESVREVRLTIGWTDVTGPSDFSVVTHVVRLEGQGAPGGTEDRSRDAIDRVRRAAEEQTGGLRERFLPPTGDRGSGSGWLPFNRQITLPGREKR